MSRLSLQKFELLDRDAKAVQLTKIAGFDGEFFHLVEWHPEQGEDVYTVMIDGHTLVSFVLRDGGSAPQEVGQQTIQTFRRQAKGSTAKSLMASLEEIEDLRRKSK